MELQIPSVETLLCEALEIPSAEQRAAYLDRACGGDGAVRREVEALLAAHDRAGGFLDPANVAATVDLPRPTEAPGTVIGPYRLMEQIGEGGFGLVFVAEQTHPVRRKVALKLIKPGMDTREVIARFEAERQALALMDHPNIARVLDAGTTESGRPYFVMELVKGVPITDYCDRAQLTPRERLELFVPVCQAVQHAHQKGVIHRDIKPSNVLVTLHDGTPVVKVIDFGVAKAIGQHLTDKTIYTRFAQMVGTPLYMSPEQAEMSGLDVDTRSDIYSLGVLLYELLTGTTPFDPQRFGRAAFDEIRRIIREEEPPRPSTRLTSLGETLSAVSARRGTEPRKLPALVRGDLDWIVMKALEKDRTRRYETASAFAADVRRFLAQELVEARPPSARYRLGKLARRNRAALTTVGLVAGALVLGTALATWQAVRATREAARATAAEARAQAELGEKERARAAAVAARKQAEDFAARLTEASALAGRGGAYARQGRWSAAQAAFARAEELQPAVVPIYVFRGPMYEQLGLWELAAADRQQVVALTRGDPAWGSSDWYQHALLRLHVGDRDGYRDACRRLIERYGDRYDSSDTVTAVRACALAPESPADPADLVRWARRANTSEKAGWRSYIEGLANYRAGQYRRAIDCVDEALKLDPDWRAKAIVHPVQAMAYHRLGRVDEARRGLAAADKAMDWWSGARSRMPLGRMSIEAVEFRLLHREATVLLTHSSPPDDPRLIAAHERALAALTDGGAAPFLDRGRTLAERGDWAAAAAEFAQALDRSDDSGDSLGAYSSISQASFEAARRPEFFAALVRLRPDSPHIWVARGRSLARKKQWAEALGDYARVMESRPPDDHAMLEYASLRLLVADAAGYRRLCARLVDRYGDTTDPIIALCLSRACTLAPGAVDDPERPVAWSRLWTEGRPDRAWTIHALGTAQYRAGRSDEAVRCFRESQRLDPRWPGQCMNEAFLALAHARLGQLDEARSCLERTDRWLADADHELAGDTLVFPQSIYPADWLIVEVVRREAAHVLADTPAEPKAGKP